MKIVVAPDTFKGALSASGVARAMAAGVRAVWPEAEVVLRPMADGGEGTLAALAASCLGTERTASVVGPLGEPRQAGWWRAADGGWAVVELARASGLGGPGRVQHLQPLRASTAGTGQLLAAAARSGVPRLVLAVGGSATVDGGVGALAALGFELLDAQGAAVPAWPDALHRIAEVVPPVDRVLPELEIWCDVDNPLCGPEGAAVVYGPQKGADAAAVAVLEAGLEHWGACLSRCFGRDPRSLPMAGAAGGIAGGLWAALGARLVPGFDAVATAVGLHAAVRGADLVLTGEGRLDAQTRRGKVAAGLLAVCEAPLWVFAGQVTPAAEAWLAKQAAVFPIADGPRTLNESLAETSALLERAVKRAGFAAGLSTL
jgi:glycerate kinase